MLHRTTLAGVVALLIGGCSSPQPKPLTLSPPPVPVKTQQSVHPAVSVARQQLGTPYRFGGTSPERGFDCSGLIHYSFKQAGINAPRTTETLFNSAFPVSGDSLRQGDLLFFRIEGKISHVGIYIDDDTFLHAPSSGKSVSYASLNNPYWQQRLIRAGRLF
ncbi:MAG: NlpC/P60 family protein [Gammaproteobacteria bacterium]|nr:NlpC/P60 family protein [Gammaproteobacteria bacterium]MCW8839516.1 NlpC/P60 family protein [Gammaproteobacteria bacterium]MCW8959605.1 NlpC/P60 family protein [Gammaproteobacteria bacterium]MCW8973467.1 NlpC/P60 family protein [Gammaproteobacteria bacterium]MCW8994103.1 NlpC/P60 family protein [Gammaproteobacteria bacterium]